MRDWIHVSPFIVGQSCKCGAKLAAGDHFRGGPISACSRCAPGAASVETCNHCWHAANPRKPPGVPLRQFWREQGGK